MVLFLLLSIFGLAFVSDSVKSKIKPKNSDKKEVSSSTSDKSIYDKVPIINSRTIAQAEDADKPHMLVAGYYSIQNGLESKLLLNNKGAYAIEIQPTIYGIGGAVLDVPSVTVDANSHRFIDLRDWANLGGSGFEEGNLQLFHTGKDLIIGSQIHLTNESKSLGFEYKLGELGKFDSRRLEAVWWNPSNQSETDVVLTNTSNDLLTVTSTLTRKPAKLNTPQEIILQPHETKVLNVRSDLNEGNIFANKKILGLSLTHDGAEDDLLAWGMTKDETLGYSNTTVFKNPNTVQSKQYHGAGLQLGKIGDDKLKPVVVIRNTSSREITVKIKVPYTKANGNKKKVKLDPITLAPKEIHKVDMSEVKQLQDVKVAGIEIKYTGRKGSVIASAQSVSHSKTQVFRTLLWDILGHRSATGGYPFYIEGTSSSVAYIKNGTKREQEYVSFLIYGEDQRYMMGLKKVAPNEVVEIDVKKLRDEQIPDENGNTLPIDISEGQIQWTAQPKEENENKAIPDKLGMVGQMIQVDTEKGINSTYFCANCCTGATIGGYVFTNATDFGVGSTAQFIAVKQEDTCYGSSYSFQFSPDSWSSSNSSIATVSGLGVATLTGVGTAQITASFQAREVFEDPCGGGGDPPLLRNNSSDKKQKKKRISTKNSDTKDKKILTSNLAPCNGCQNFYYPWTFNEDLIVKDPKVEYSEIGSIEEGGSKDITATLKHKGNYQVTLFLKKANNQATNGITFGNGASSKSLPSNGSHTITIKGITKSTQLEDYKIEARYDNNFFLAGQKLFTVSGLYFIENSACSGFDSTANKDYLLVPKGGTNKLKVVTTPSGATGDFKLDVSTPPTNQVSVSPTSVTNNTVVTVTGGNTVGNFLVKARANQQNTNHIGEFNVGVRNQINKTITFYAVTEDGNPDTPPPASNIPTANGLQTYLNNVWGKQANVYFTVTAGTPFEVNYDLDNDGKIDSQGNMGAEPVAIASTSSDQNSDFNAYFLGLGVKPIGGTTPAAFTNISFGLTYVGPTYKGTRDYITAHEIGHALGTSGQLTDNSYLMYENDLSTSPCKIGKRVWDIVNPSGSW